MHEGILIICAYMPALKTHVCAHTQRCNSYLVIYLHQSLLHNSFTFIKHFAINQTM